MDHSYGGLSVTAPFAIDGIRRGQPPGGGRGEIEIVLREGALPPIEDLQFAWPGRYLLEIGETADGWLMRSRFDSAFLIDCDGRRITMICETLPPSPGSVEVLARRVLPRVVVLHGAVPIHSATLAKPEGALLLLGSSGAGKSTMSAALAHLGGFDVFSDDISVLWPGEVPEVAPATTGVCVWPASRVGLDLPLDRCIEMPAYDGKVRYESGQDTIAHSVPVRGLIILDRGKSTVRPSLEPVSRPDAISHTIPQVIQLNPNGSSAAERVASLTFLTSVTHRTSNQRLVYPDDFAALPEVVDLLARTIA